MEDRFMLARTCLAAIALAFLAIAPFGQDNKVYDQLSPEDVGQALGGLKIKFEKRPDSDRKDRVYFYFNHKGQPITLFYLSGGKSLMLQTLLTKTTLAKINAWNDQALFSRAYLGSSDARNDKSVLEWNLDTDGPVTANALQRFIRGFNDEVEKFAKFIGQPVVPGKEEPLAKELGNDLTKLELRMHELTQQLIPDDTTIVMTFPIADEDWKTAWKVTWDITPTLNERTRPNNFFRITKAWFKSGPKEPWLQVLGEARVSEIFTAYSDGVTRFHDMRDFSFPLLKLSRKDVGMRGRVIGKDKKVAAEIRDRGVMWGTHVYDKEKVGHLKSRRGQDLVLWAVLGAGNYDYLIQYGFQDDGTITFRIGATAYNFPTKTDVSHMHNACWRIHLNLDGKGKSSVYAVRHEEALQGAGKAVQKEQLINVEGAGEWHPKEFTSLRVKHLLQQGNAKPREIAYDLLPLRQGSSRHYGKGEEFTHHDYWVTPNAAGELYYYNLPKYLSKNKLNPRPTVNTDVVLWYMSSVLHAPRAEDGHIENGGVLKHAKGVALAAWSGFDLRPRNLFLTTPLYP
jgi:primary-amine oxidase